jgi:hypothetical protein
VDESHPWRPPFGLDRVGQPLTILVQASQPPSLLNYRLTLRHRGRDVARYSLEFTTKPPYSASIRIAGHGDELVLSTGIDIAGYDIELARQRLQTARIEAESLARPESVVNPVDLGTILVPHGWLLLGPGQMVTPCYWGSHWPLARGNGTGSKIDDRIALTPCHNSVMSWASASPDPIFSRDFAPGTRPGGDTPLRLRRWAWLIGMTDDADGRLLQWARSSLKPPSLEVRGANRVSDDLLEDPRAPRFQVQGQRIAITLKPQPVCVNPALELVGAPKGMLVVTREGRTLERDQYAWDDRILWLNATIDAPTELRLEFRGSVRRAASGPTQP